MRALFINFILTIAFFEQRIQKLEKEEVLHRIIIIVVIIIIHQQGKQAEEGTKVHSIMYKRGRREQERNEDSVWDTSTSSWLQRVVYIVACVRKIIDCWDGDGALLLLPCSQLKSRG